MSERASLCEFRRLTRFPYPQIALILLYALGMVVLAIHGGIQ